MTITISYYGNDTAVTDVSTDFTFPLFKSRTDSLISFSSTSSFPPYDRLVLVLVCKSQIFFRTTTSSTFGATSLIFIFFLFLCVCHQAWDSVQKNVSNCFPLFFCLYSPNPLLICSAVRLLVSLLRHRRERQAGLHHLPAQQPAVQELGQAKRSAKLLSRSAQ